MAVEKLRIEPPSLEVFQNEILLALDQKAWIEATIEEIGQDTLADLLLSARDIRENAYAPYSNYKVGASLLTQNGRIYEGVNTEVASYSETGHAEGNAIANAIIWGEAREGRKFIKALSVVHEGGYDKGPCGRCRQCIKEHSDNALIIIWNGNKNQQPWTTSLVQLFPNAFGPTDLGIE